MARAAAAGDAAGGAYTYACGECKATAFAAAQSWRLQRHMLSAACAAWRCCELCRRGWRQRRRLRCGSGLSYSALFFRWLGVGVGAHGRGAAALGS